MSDTQETEPEKRTAHEWEQTEHTPYVVVSPSGWTADGASATTPITLAEYHERAATSRVALKGSAGAEMAYFARQAEQGDEWEVVARSRMRGANWWAHPMHVTVRANSLAGAMRAAAAADLVDDWHGFGDDTTEPEMLREARLVGRAEQRRRIHDYLTGEAAPKPEPVDGSGHITLDKTNLLRLCKVARTYGPTREALQQADPIATHVEADAFVLGWEAAVEGIEAIAAEMPDLYGDAGCPVPHSEGATT